MAVKRRILHQHELRKDVKTPDVHITTEAYLEIRSLVRLCDKEVGWFGSVKKKDDEYCIYSIHMFDQKVHGAETDIDAASIAKVAMDLYSEGRDTEVNEMRFWGHSHVNMGVGPSGQDVKQAKEFGDNDMPFMICGIFNKEGKIRIDFYDYANNEVWEDLPLYLGSPEQLETIDEKIKAEIEEHVDEFKPVTKSGNFRPYSYDYDYDSEWGEYPPRFDSWGRSYGKPHSVPVSQVGNSVDDTVGRGQYRTTQHSQPVVHAGSGGTQQGQSTGTQPVTSKPSTGTGNK